MSTPQRRTANPIAPATREATRKHIEQNYRGIGIDAVSSALAMMKLGQRKQTTTRDVPPLLRKENVFA
jgi:hypothetical protein